MELFGVRGWPRGFHVLHIFIMIFDLSSNFNALIRDLVKTRNKPTAINKTRMYNVPRKAILDGKVEAANHPTCLFSKNG